MKFEVLRTDLKEENAYKSEFIRNYDDETLCKTFCRRMNIMAKRSDFDMIFTYRETTIKLPKIER